MKKIALLIFVVALFQPLDANAGIFKSIAKFLANSDTEEQNEETSSIGSPSATNDIEAQLKENCFNILKEAKNLASVKNELGIDLISQLYVQGRCESLTGVPVDKIYDNIPIE